MKSLKFIINSPGLREHVRNNLQASRLRGDDVLGQFLRCVDGIGDWVALQLTKLVMKKTIGVGISAMMGEINKQFATINPNPELVKKLLAEMGEPDFGLWSEPPEECQCPEGCQCE